MPWQTKKNRAEEVIASAASQRSLDQWFARRSPVNFSTVRQKYRTSRKHARDEKTEMYSIYNQIKHYLHWHPYVSRARDLLFANQTIVLIVKQSVTKVDDRLSGLKQRRLGEYRPFGRCPAVLGLFGRNEGRI